MPVATLTLHFRLPYCRSLKEKRSQLKPILVRLRREFNLSSAEMALQDHWHEAVIACAMVGDDPVFLRNGLQVVQVFFERTWPDLPILSENLEIC